MMEMPFGIVSNSLGKTFGICLISFENMPNFLFANLSNIRNRFYILLQSCH